MTNMKSLLLSDEWNLFPSEQLRRKSSAPCENCWDVCRSRQSASGVWDLSGSQPDVLADSFQGGLLSSETLYRERPRDPGSFQPSLSCSEQNRLPFRLLPLLPSLDCTTLAFCLCRQMAQQRLLTWTPQIPRGSRIRFRRPWTLKP